KLFFSVAVLNWAVDLCSTKECSLEQSSQGQAEIACPCDDCSKEHSLVEHKSTAQFNTATEKNSLRFSEFFLIIQIMGGILESCT
ncbi:hypothetical protein, partial [Bacillus sp. 7884-1]|uniref:hypothetical protein n=1 Tax=Bacillus sp. 7884-1 TaxID=2021693 RepID=UPI000BC6C2C2